MADTVVKVFIRTGSYYLMSRKRAPGRTADGRLEHLGGHLEAGETALEAMIREAHEEERTGRLAVLIEQERPEARRVRVGRDSQLHFLFELTVEESEVDAFKADNKESYGFELVSAEQIDTDGGLAEMRDILTPKTIAIYQALGRCI